MEQLTKYLNMPHLQTLIHLINEVLLNHLRFVDDLITSDNLYNLWAILQQLTIE